MPNLRQTTSTYADGRSEDRVSDQYYATDQSTGGSTLIRRGSSYDTTYEQARSGGMKAKYASEMATIDAITLATKNRLRDRADGDRKAAAAALSDQKAAYKKFRR